jgi:putative PIN family toxin of toxin-antitoxin system
MRVTCDTNVLVRAALTPAGAASDLLEIIVRDHILIASLPILAELLEVLQRPRLSNLYRLDTRTIQRFVGQLHRTATIVPLPTQLPAVVLRDPRDNPIVLTAVLGIAGVLCTRDQHLLDPSVSGFCASHGVRLLTDIELLTELRQR